MMSPYQLDFISIYVLRECRFDRLIESMSSITCDCLPDGGENCFAESEVVPTAEGSVCAAQQLTINVSILTSFFQFSQLKYLKKVQRSYNYVFQYFRKFRLPNSAGE
jgi:hypothetical protein